VALSPLPPAAHTRKQKTNPYTSICICTHMYVCMCVCIYIYIHYVCMYVCVYILHIYIYAYTYNIYSAARNATHTRNRCTTLKESSCSSCESGLQKKNAALFAAGANCRACCCLARVCCSSLLQLESVAARVCCSSRRELSLESCEQLICCCLEGCVWLCVPRLYFFTSCFT
jgi:hypothetical protein